MLKLFQKLKRRGYFLTNFKASITLISKPDEDISRKEIYRISPVNIDAKIVNKILAN